MSEEPIYEATTERLWRHIPEIYRRYDAGNDWQFKKYISAIGSQQNIVDTLIERFTKVPANELASFKANLDPITDNYSRPEGIENEDIGFEPLLETSDLVDARTADSEWLPFIAQIQGVNLTNSDISVRRYALLYSNTSYMAGSILSIKSVIQSYLSGSKYIAIYPHHDGLFDDITHVGTEWDLLIVTRTTENPDEYDFSSIMDQARVKPAGVLLHFIERSVTWEDLETLDWSGIEALGDWDGIEDFIS